METIAKRVKRSVLSDTAEQVLAQCEHRLCTEEDLAVAIIRDYLSDLRHFAACANPPGVKDGGLGYMIKKYAERAKVSDVSPHDLRHRFGYRMAKSVPCIGSLDTTLIYIKATKSVLQKEIEKIAWV